MPLFVRLLLVLFTPVLAFAQYTQLETAEDCQACHEDIYQAWAGSMHARSTLSTNVLYRGMFTWASEETKGAIARQCKNCHTPYFSLQDQDLVTYTDRERPVDCLFCHSIDNLHRDPVFSEVKFSSRDNERSDYHRIRAREHFSNEELCMLCHAQLTNPHEVPICVTGEEYYGQKEGQPACQSCHMPLMQGYRSSESDSASLIRSHAFVGPYTPAFLEKSLQLSAQYADETLTVTIDNSQTPHGYPTGSPLRMVLLKVIGFDANNKIIYQNWKGNPVEEDQQAVLVRFFADAEQNFPVPPWKARSVRMDTRLKPGEIRNIVYSINQEVKQLSIQLFFLLAPAPILNRLQIDDPYLRKAHLIDQISLTIK